MSSLSRSLPIVAAGVFVVLRIRRKPKDKEQRRRLEVNTNGRLATQPSLEITDDAIFYEYSVGGITYTASQDISKLRELIPADPASPDRPAGVAEIFFAESRQFDSVVRGVVRIARWARANQPSGIAS